MLRPLPIALSLLIPLAASPVWAEPPTDLGVIPSVALSDDASALAINPAGLGVGTPASLMATREGWSSGTTHLLLNAGSLGLGYTHNSAAGVPYNDYATGLGLGSVNSLRMGLGFHLPAEGRPWSYDLGLLSRPMNYLSLGLAVRNALATPGALGSMGREYQVGAGFRPFGPHFTLSVDLPYLEGTPLAFSNLQPFVGLEAQVVDGIKLRGTVSTTGDFMLGVGLNTAQLGIGAMAHGDRFPAYVRFSGVREPSVLGFKGTRWAKLDLTDALALASRSRALLGPTSDVPPVYPVLEALDAAEKDPQVGALIVKIGSMPSGWGTLEEVRSALLNFKKSGKPVWAYLEEADFPGYYVASAADRIFMNPMGSLEVTGLSHDFTYFKGLMNTLGIQPHFIAMGRYKTAMEPFERKDPSAAQREQYQAILGDQFDRVIEGIAQGRKLPVSKVRALVDQGIFEAPNAQSAGLVDELAQRDEVPQRLEKQIGHGLSAVNALALDYRKEAWAPPVVAVIRASGGISEGQGGNDLLQGPSMGADTMVEAMRAVREDAGIKAVVFRIDSPGGSAMASEVMRRELTLLAAKKPVIISFGDVAASGGYWIAMIPGSPVYADPGTITGSIGVLSGKFDISGLLAKWGVTNTTLKEGDRADVDSMLRGYTPAEEARLTSAAEFYYGKFVSLVATERNLSEGRVRELASGHVYTGSMALKLRLVDKLAGLSEAIREAGRRAGLDGQEYALAFYPEVSPFGSLLESPGGQLRLRTDLSLASELKESAAHLAPWGRDGVWLIPPQAVGVE